MKPEMLFHEAAKVFVVETRSDKGWKLDQHIHEHDHLAYLASGICDVEENGIHRNVVGPTMLIVKANTPHSITALTPIIWLCLWGTDFGVQEEAKQSLMILEAL